LRLKAGRFTNETPREPTQEAVEILLNVASDLTLILRNPLSQTGEGRGEGDGIKNETHDDYFNNLLRANRNMVACPRADI